MEEATSLCGSSKRGNKGTGNILQIVNCLVDGCNADLNLCREYHRRHKVCELHSKSPRVTICGREQRFCQQCSRFHSLSEFDDEKRSCRKRLDGHNKRRRKPQPESLTRNSGLIFSTQQGTRLVSFGSPVTFNGGSTWPTVINNNQTDLNHIIRRNSINEPSTQFQFIDSDRNRDHDQALSLLSSAPPPPPPPPSVTIGFNNHHMVQSQNLQFNNNLAQYPFESKPIIDNSNVHFHEMFQNGPDGSSTSGSQQTLTFMWK